MGAAVKFEFEWQEAPGVRDNVLAATWSRLGLSVGGLCASEAIDLRSNSRRTGIYGSLFPLAEWLVEHWWHLLHEPSPRSPVPGGRAAPQILRSWVQRHNLLAARDGGALPDLTIARDGDDILFQWEADPVSPTTIYVRFVGQGKSRVSVTEFERSVGSFVEAVFARLEDRLPDNEEVKRAVEAWHAIHSADSAEVELCRSLAIMGVDPYDPDEATDALIETVERGIRVLPDELRADLFEGSDQRSLMNDLTWVERERAGLHSAVNSPGFPTIDVVSDLTTHPTAHEIGYTTARRVRLELLRMPSDEPLLDLHSALVDSLGWLQNCSRVARGETHLDGMVGLDDTSSAPLLVIADSRSEVTERFRLARAAFFPVTKSLGAGARLLTRSVTPPQRTARAFAAELLAPAEALAKRVSGRLNDQDVDNLATEFMVSQQLIRHQVENHNLGYVEA